MKNFNLKGKHKGQALTEFVIIIVFVGLLLVAASSDLFDSIKKNYYNGMIPISKKADLPETPEGEMPEEESNEDPVAKIEGPTKAKVGEKVIFVDASHSPNGRIVGTSWGEGTLEMTFTEAGEHIILLEVVDNNGNTDKAELKVQVEPNLPVPVIDILITDGSNVTNGFRVSGNNSYSELDYEIVDWEWHLVNPNNSRQKMNWPLSGHTFGRNALEHGLNTIQLRVKDSDGNWSEIERRNVNYR